MMSLTLYALAQELRQADLDNACQEALAKLADNQQRCDKFASPVIPAWRVEL